MEWLGSVRPALDSVLAVFITSARDCCPILYV
nr:MAG TPA: hypothetical protein [Caudoviricetes sp.]